VIIKTPSEIGKLCSRLQHNWKDCQLQLIRMKNLYYTLMPEMKILLKKVWIVDIE